MCVGGGGGGAIARPACVHVREYKLNVIYGWLLWNHFTGVKTGMRPGSRSRSNQTFQKKG